MNETIEQEKTTQLGSRNETTQLCTAFNHLQPPGENNSTQQQERTTQLGSRNETTQICTAVDRLQPPAPPLQQNRLFLPTKGVIIMPIRRTEVKSFALSTGIQSVTIPNSFIGQLPTRIIMAMVSNTAFNGDFGKNPFNFKHYDISYICAMKVIQCFPQNPFNRDSMILTVTAEVI
ncbi:uncharacterized protein F54H12.2 [Trichonephila clavipes]|nr:uncharacterized protein F54H12.2 [Trichonephila clavipes]